MKEFWFIKGSSKAFGLKVAWAILQPVNQVIAVVRYKSLELERAAVGYSNVLIKKTDVTDKGGANESVVKYIKHFGRIEVLANGLGFGLVSEVEEALSEEVRKRFTTKVFGMLNLVRAIFPFMRKMHSGLVIVITAFFALGAITGLGIYIATKYAVADLTEGLALELASLIIYATVIESGMFTTSFLDKESFMKGKYGIKDCQYSSGSIRIIISEFNGTHPEDPYKFALTMIKLLIQQIRLWISRWGGIALNFDKNKEKPEKEMAS